MTVGQFLELLAGLAIMALSGLAWSGHWRRWAQSPFLRVGPITVIPGLGLILVFWALLGVLPPTLGDAFLAVAFLLLLASLVLLVVDPDWFGPRWYRRFKRAFAEGMSGSFAWMAEDPQRPDETAVQATERHLLSDRPNPPGPRVRLLSETSGQVGGIAGRRSYLLFFPHAPALAVQGTEELLPRDEIIDAESLRGVRKLDRGVGLDGRVRRDGWRSRLVPRVRIDTAECSWLFETRHAKDVAREIERRYLDPSRDMYGMSLEEGERSGGHPGGKARSEQPWGSQENRGSPPG